MARRHANIVNLEESLVLDGPAKGKFKSRMFPLGRAAGAQQLGCTFYELEPGKAAFPYHWHGANEEALIVLSGLGTLRLNGEEFPVRAGDFVALPAGTAHAHQLRNTGSDPLRYYCLSTMHPVEAAGYPDSDKVGVMVREGQKMALRNVFRLEDSRDYFDRDPMADEESKG